jgi:hypothetical protein
MDTVLSTSLLAAAAALGGVLVTVIADGTKEKRRLVHERTVRAEERHEATAARRAAFELDNLIAAYDAIWLLARESTKIHMADRRAGETTEHGYGGTLLPEGLETDIKVTSQATKTIRLILDDTVRNLALEASNAMSDVSTLGVRAKLEGWAPVSVERGEAEHNIAVTKVARRWTPSPTGYAR